MDSFLNFWGELPIWLQYIGIWLVVILFGLAAVLVRGVIFVGLLILTIVVSSGAGRIEDPYL